MQKKKNWEIVLRPVNLGASQTISLGEGWPTLADRQGRHQHAVGSSLHYRREAQLTGLGHLWGKDEHQAVIAVAGLQTARPAHGIFQTLLNQFTSVQQAIKGVQ